MLKGIATFFGEQISELTDKIKALNFDFDPDISNLVKEIMESSKNPTYKDLIEELSSICVELDAFDGYYNKETDYKEGVHLIKNPVGINKELYVKDCLKGHKILIVMLWTCDLSKNESEFIKPEYILKPNPKDEEELINNQDEDEMKENEKIMCIKSAADHYGIELKIVLNYEDAINEITKQSKPGKCDYYAIWIICGPPYPILPPQEIGNEYKNNPHLINQFINILIKYWENNGSIFFLAEGSELHYQLDLFLEKVEFPNYCKVKFKIEDEDKGEGYLYMMI